MATINPTVVAAPNRGLVVTWGPFTESDTITPWEGWDCADKCFQVTGTFPAGGIGLKGNNDGGATGYALNDTTGAAIAITAAGLKQVLENPRYVWPYVVSGTSASVTVTLVARNTNT